MDPSTPASPESTSLRQQSPPVATVALLDDDIRFIRMVERVLREESIAVFPVTTVDLDDAVAVVAGERCDLAMVDVFMYDNAAGFDLVERLRANPATSQLPLIVSSGAQREVARRIDFLHEHRCGLLLKPFSPDDLISAVRQQLAAASVAHAAPTLIHMPALPARMMPSVASRSFAGPAEALAPSQD